MSYILVPMVRSYKAPDIQLPRIEPGPPGHGESEKSVRVEPERAAVTEGSLILERDKGFNKINRYLSISYNIYIYMYVYIYIYLNEIFTSFVL